MEPILKTENLWKVYRPGKVEVAALRGVSVDVMPGEFISIMGPSGCGKSTFLHVIGGLASPSRGQVLLDGNDLSALTMRRGRVYAGTKSDSSSSDSICCPRSTRTTISRWLNIFTATVSILIASRSSPRCWAWQAA